MKLTWSGVRARRLERHGLARPWPDADPATVAAALAGVHAQVMSAAELGIGLRLASGTRERVRAALWTERSLVKTYGPRGTVHLLPAADLPLWTAALSAVPVAPDRFPPQARMSEEQVEAVVAAIGDALDDAELTVDELGEAVVAATGAWAGDLVMPAFQGMWPRWRQVMHLAGIRGALCFGAGRGRKVTYTSPRRWIPGFRPAETSAGLAHVARSYLYAYGPGTPERFAHWLAAPVAWAKEVFDSLDLQPVEVEGAPAWVPAGDTEPPGTSPRGVRLLPYFDPYAYRVGNQPPELLFPASVTDRSLRGNFQLLIVDGVVAGRWHQRRSGRHIDITVDPLVRLDTAQRTELHEQAERVAEILESTPRLTLGPVPVGGHA